MADGPTAPGALLLPVGGLVPLLRNDCPDTAFAQVGPVATGRVGLVPSDRARAGAGAADGLTDSYLVEHGDELRTVRGLSRGQDERQRAALSVRSQVDLAGLPAPRPTEQGGLQPEFPPAPDASSLFPLGIVFGVLPGLFVAAAPFDLAFSSSAAAFSRAVRTSWSRCIPAAS